MKPTAAKLLQRIVELELRLKPPPAALIWGKDIDWLPPDALPIAPPPQRIEYTTQKLLPPPPPERTAAAGADIPAPRDNPPKGDAYA